MSPIDCLIFDCRVPPAVEQKDVASELQVEANAARSVTHQQHMFVRVIAKGFDHAVALFRGNLAVVFQRAELL